MLCGSAVMLAVVPWFWTRQGVDVTGHGISITQRPMWWHRGRAAEIPWRDVHHIAPTRVAKYPGSESADPVLELFLHRVDHGLRLPRWARPVLAGEVKWSRVASLPRIVISLTDPEALRKLESLLRRARPDLFDPPAFASPHLTIRRRVAWVYRRSGMGPAFPRSGSAVLVRGGWRRVGSCRIPRDSGRAPCPGALRSLG